MGFVENHISHYTLDISDDVSRRSYFIPKFFFIFIKLVFHNEFL